MTAVTAPPVYCGGIELVVPGALTEGLVVTLEVPVVTFGYGAGGTTVALVYGVGAGAVDVVEADGRLRAQLSPSRLMQFTNSAVLFGASPVVEPTIVIGMGAGELAAAVSQSHHDSMPWIPKSPLLPPLKVALKSAMDEFQFKAPHWRGAAT